MVMERIREFHLFAGIGGGIYGGGLLGHKCVGAVEILPYAQQVLNRRQEDGWMDGFPIHGDIRSLDGRDFRGGFDVLCGGFPCQAFSTAAHGKNIASKNLWDEMLRFAEESNAPVVFGENVVLRAIDKAKSDLEGIGYRTERIRLGCSDLGANHRRNRFWLLAVKDADVFSGMFGHLSCLPLLTNGCWSEKPCESAFQAGNGTRNRKQRITGVGNAQSPIVAAVAFRILANRLGRKLENRIGWKVSPSEISAVFDRRKSWIDENFKGVGFVHTPTTMANYSCPYMMRHQCCRNFVKVFGRPSPENAEYLMGFPPMASSLDSQSADSFESWRKSCLSDSARQVERQFLISDFLDL